LSDVLPTANEEKRMKEKSKLQANYIQKTIRNLTNEELTSIQLSNNNLGLTWSFAITQEITRRYLPIIITVIIANYVSNILEKI